MVMVVADSWITTPVVPDSDAIVPHTGLEVLVDDDVPHAIIFMAYVKDFKWNSRDGELNITLAAPMAEKDRAMKITDHPGMMLDVTVKVVQFEDEEDDDGE